MGGNALAAVQNLDPMARHACVDLLTYEAVRNAVIVVINFDVVVNVDAALHEGRDLVSARRQRAQRRLVEPLEPFAVVALELFERTPVQVGDQLADRLVQFGQTVEPVVAQPCKDPALDDLYADLDLRLVLRLARPRRQHGGRVVVHEVLRGVAQHRFVPIGLGDQCLWVVGHQQLGNAAVEFQRVDQTADPVGHGLGTRRTCIGVVRGAEDGHEHVGLERDAAVAAEDRHGLPGEVGEQLLAGAVLLAHRALQRRSPVLVPLAELRIAVGALVGVSLDVLLPEQLPRHALAAQVAMHYRVIRLDPPGRGRGFLRQVQPDLELVVGQRFDSSPVESCRAGACSVCRDGADANADRAADLAVRQAARPLQPQYFLQFAHAHPMCRHQPAP